MESLPVKADGSYDFDKATPVVIGENGATTITSDDKGHAVSIAIPYGTYIYDYRAKLKQKFYFYQDMSKDDDVPKKLQNDFLHQMYEDFGTIEEDCFYDRLEDGKYDEGFKERQVKEEKSR